MDKCQLESYQLIAFLYPFFLSFFSLSYLSYFSTSFIFLKHALTKNDVGIVVNLGKGGVRRDAERANVEAVHFAALNI